MLHLRIVSPSDRAEQVLDVLGSWASVCNVVHVPHAARSPEGDLVLADVAREDASVVIDDLRRLGIPESGSISLEEIDTAISLGAERAERAAAGAPADAVVWEEVEERTSDQAALTGTFLVFIVAAALLAGVGILLDSPILIVGAMVVGPEFGPIAGFCVAAVTRRRRLALRSLLALAIGFPAAITAAWIATLIYIWTGLGPATFDESHHELSELIADPGAFSALVALFAGVAGMLSLSTAKSGAIIGVLISVTTIPAAANIGLAAAYGDWPAWRGSMGQLTLNLACILVAGVVTLAIQRMLYRHRREDHQAALERARARRSPARRSSWWGDR